MVSAAIVSLSPRWILPGSIAHGRRSNSTPPSLSTRAVIPEHRIDFGHDAVGALEQMQRTSSHHMLVKRHDPVTNAVSSPSSRHRPNTPPMTANVNLAFAFAWFRRYSEAFDHMGAGQQGVGERLKVTACLNPESSRDWSLPQGRDHLVIGEFTSPSGDSGTTAPGSFSHGNLHKTGGPKKAGMGKEQWRSGCQRKPEQEQCHQQEVVAAHRDDFDIRSALAKPFQVAGRVDAAKAAAEYHDSFHGISPPLEAIAPPSRNRGRGVGAEG